jgi:hypothetical protein
VSWMIFRVLTLLNDLPLVAYSRMSGNQNEPLNDALGKLVADAA